MATEGNMKKNERLRYEMFLRVRDFGNAHRQQFPDGSMGGKAFRAVGAAIAEIDAHNTARVLHGRGGKKARSAAREALVERLMAIARTARLMSKASPGSDGAFRIPSNSSDVALLTAARAILQESQAAVDRLVLLGLPKTFVTDLQELIDRFEQGVHGRRTGRAGVAAALAGLEDAFARAHDAVLTLDIVVGNTLRKDPVVLAVWRRDRRVNPKSRAAAVVSAPAVALPDMTPPNAPVPAPARPVAVTSAFPIEEPVAIVSDDDVERKAS